MITGAPERSGSANPSVNPWLLRMNFLISERSEALNAARRGYKLNFSETMDCVARDLYNLSSDQWEGLSKYKRSKFRSSAKRFIKETLHNGEISSYQTPERPLLEKLHSLKDGYNDLSSDAKLRMALLFGESIDLNNKNKQLKSTKRTFAPYRGYLESGKDPNQTPATLLNPKRYSKYFSTRAKKTGDEKYQILSEGLAAEPQVANPSPTKPKKPSPSERIAQLEAENAQLKYEVAISRLRDQNNAEIVRGVSERAERSEVTIEQMQAHIDLLDQRGQAAITASRVELTYAQERIAFEQDRQTDLLVENHELRMQVSGLTAALAERDSKIRYNLDPKIKELQEALVAANKKTEEEEARRLNAETNLAHYTAEYLLARTQGENGHSNGHANGKNGNNGLRTRLKEVLGSEDFALFGLDSMALAANFSPSDQLDILRRAYRILIGRLHPDHNPGNTLAEQATVNINAAFKRASERITRASRTS